MPVVEGLEVGDKLIEGKTKVVYALPSEAGNCLIVSKDRITAGDGVRAHDMQGKAAISTATNAKIYDFLTSSGVRTHFIRHHSDTSFVARQCSMIPIEWVTRRIATGSFLKRNPGVPEGYRFCPPKLETFFKDDANHDPQWSEEQLISAKLKCADRVISASCVRTLLHTTRAIFEILERAWTSLGCQLVDMKIEFGVDTTTGELLLADVIDSDSWRLWPGGDKRLMKDKQVYRDMKEVTQEGLDTVKQNFRWISEQLDKFKPASRGRAVVLMGSPSDKDHCEKIAKECRALGVPCELRCTSAHKGTDETLKVLSEYEAISDPVVLIAVAGRSNGLGPVLAGNTALPVINCPPLGPEWAAQDVWSSLRLPTGLGCTTTATPDAAASAAASILALTDHVIWSRLRAKQLNASVALIKADNQFVSAAQH